MVVVLLVAGSVSAGGQPTGESYDGQYVSLDATETSVTEYAVGGEVVASSIQAQSAAQLGEDTNLSVLTNLEGGVFDDQQVGDTTATMTTATAQLQAHDNPRGVFTIQPIEEPQYARIGLPEGAETVEEGNGTVTYRTGNGVLVAVLLVGDGEIAVEEGNVVARIAPESQLVVRVSTNGDEEAFAGENRLVADGVALGELYVLERDPDVVVDTVAYDQGTTLRGSRAAESAVEAVVERQAQDGGAVVVGASEGVLPDDPNVTVDGEPAERADYDDLAEAVGGNRSRFAVAEGDATAVTVAINEFPGSSRRIVVSPAAADDEQDGSVLRTGFAALAAVVVGSARTAIER